MPAAHRTLVHTRAANVQYYKPHAMEDTYYWRTVAGDQLEDHRERIIGALNPSDKKPLHPVLFKFRSAIRDDLNRRPLSEGPLLLPRRQDRQRHHGSHHIFEFLQTNAHLSPLYSPILTGGSQPRSPSRTPIRSPRPRFSAIASDRRSRHPISPMRDIFRAQSAVNSPTAAAAHSHPSSKGKRKRYFDDRISAIISAIRSEFSDDDSQDSSPESPSDSTQPCDVPHNDDDQDRDPQELANDLSAFAKKPGSRPGKFGTPFIDGSFRSHSQPKLSGPTQFTPVMALKLAASKGTTSSAITTPTTSVPTSAKPDSAPPTTNQPAKYILTTQDAPSVIIRHALIKIRVCFYFAYGLSCPYDPCKYLHEASDIPYTYSIVVRSHPTPQGLPWLPSTIPRKPTDPKTSKTRNEGAPLEQLRSWGTVMLFSSALIITPFINQWWKGMPGEPQ